MTQYNWFNIGLAIAGVLMGMMAAKFKLSPNAVINGNGRKLSTYHLEIEVSSLLRNMRTDMDRNFSHIEEQHAEILRRLRNHDDDMFDIKKRVERLEDK